VVIDPYRTRLAARAETHLALRPGSDLALALGLLGVIIRERLYDEELVTSQMVGFDELRETVGPLTPEWAGEQTGLDPHEIHELAAYIAAAPSACGHTGVALEQSTHGLQTCRAVHALWAITGNAGRPGGWRLLPRAGTEAERAARSLDPNPEEVTERPVGAAEHPLFADLLGEAQGNLLPKAILEDDPYPVRSLFIMGANPALSGPDTGATRRALERLDMLVVADPMLTETTELAHVVLPSATFLEADDYVAMRNVGEVEAAVPARGEAWPDWKVVFELARRLGLGDYFPWETGREAREAQTAAMRQMGPPSHEQFLTPSGKIELASERVREAGQPAVPGPVEPPPSERFPLLLTTGARQPGFCNSQLRGVPLVEARVGPPVAEVSPETAAELSLRHGQRVRLGTPHGSLEVTLYALRGLRPGVVRLPHCMSEANANELSSIEGRDPATGFANLRILPCRLTQGG
jgi:anaerobic selenocysteine-containing dehydrogenase